MAMMPLITNPPAGEPVLPGAALVADKKVRPDATRLLAQDHREALDHFAWYEGAREPATKIVVAQKLCSMLRAHMQIEEEIFYPTVRKALADKGADTGIVDHGIDEHKEAREIIERAEAGIARGEAPDEAIAALEPAIQDHVDDEESELFQAVRKTDLDLYGLGLRLAVRKVALLFELTGRSSGQHKEDHIMTASQEDAHKLFLAGLRDVHAAVEQGKELVVQMLDRVESYPKVRERLSAHLKEKENQLQRLHEIMESFDEKRSWFKDMTMTSAGNIMAMMTANTEDEILKNSLYSYGLANFGAASYESLVILGTAAGHKEAVKKLQSSLSEERAMAAWLGGNMRGLINDHLQLRREGLQASH